MDRGRAPDAEADGRHEQRQRRDVRCGRGRRDQVVAKVDPSELNASEEGPHRLRALDR